MRKKARKSTAQREEVSEEQETSQNMNTEPEKVSLQVWMRDRLAKDKRLRPEHLAALQVHMKKRGLGAMEPAEAYENAYKTY